MTSIGVESIGLFLVDCRTVLQSNSNHTVGKPSLIQIGEPLCLILVSFLATVDLWTRRKPSRRGPRGDQRFRAPASRQAWLRSE